MKTRDLLLYGIVALLIYWYWSTRMVKPATVGAESPEDFFPTGKGVSI